MVFGMFCRFFRLCSDHSDVLLAIKHLHNRLCRQGHAADFLKPIFSEACKRCFKNKKPREVKNNNNNHVCLHLTYNKHDISRRQIQQYFKNTMLNPPGEPPLPSMCNDSMIETGTDRLTIACRRPCNLKNMLSPRILRDEIAQLTDTVAANLQVQFSFPQ